jgi:hypothetical protein
MSGGRRIVHGTPITPNHLLDSLRGHSFCVSFANPDQVDRCVELVGDDEILILDNGAFTIWQCEQNPDRTLPARLQFNSPDEYRAAFWNWANAIQARCEQAVAVIPDVITGSEQQNLIEISHAIRYGLAEFPERTMSIWHMDESNDFLSTQCRLMNFIGIGSCAEFDVQKNRAGYLDKMREVGKVVAAIDAVHGSRPWVHLMRGLGVFKSVAWVDSADSTNVARNHCRYKEHGNARAINFANRIAAPIQAAAMQIPLKSSGQFNQEKTA